MADSNPAIAAIFDLDRTLATLPVDIAAVRAALDGYALPLGVTSPWRPILDCLGGLEAALRPSLGDGAAALAEGAWGLFDHLEARDAEAATPCAGAAEAIAEAGRRGIPLGLVTNNGRGAALAALAAVSIPLDAFVCTVCRREAGPSKPSPQGLMRAFWAMKQARPQLSELFCVGDATTDVQAARALSSQLSAAGVSVSVRVVSVATGFSSKAQLEAAEPDILLDDLVGLWDKLLA